MLRFTCSVSEFVRARNIWNLVMVSEVFAGRFSLHSVIHAHLDISPPLTTINFQLKYPTLSIITLRHTLNT